MDSLMYPGTDKLWPTRVADPPPSSAFVDLTSQNEPYHRNQGTCRYEPQSSSSSRGEMNWTDVPVVDNSFSLPKNVFERVLASQTPVSITCATSAKGFLSPFANCSAGQQQRRRTSGDYVTEHTGSDAKRPRLSPSITSEQDLAQRRHNKQLEREQFKLQILRRLDNTKTNILKLLKLQRMQNLVHYYENDPVSNQVAKFESSQRNELRFHSQRGSAQETQYQTPTLAPVRNDPRPVSVSPNAQSMRSSSHLHSSSHSFRHVPEISVVADQWKEQRTKYSYKSSDSVGLAWDHKTLPKIVAVHSKINRANASAAKTLNHPTPGSAVGCANHSREKSQIRQNQSRTMSLTSGINDRATALTDRRYSQEDEEVVVTNVLPESPRCSISTEERTKTKTNYSSPNDLQVKRNNLATVVQATSYENMKIVDHPGHVEQSLLTENSAHAELSRHSDHLRHTERLRHFDYPGHVQHPGQVEHPGQADHTGHSADHTRHDEVEINQQRDLTNGPTSTDSSTTCQGIAAGASKMETVRSPDHVHPGSLQYPEHADSEVYLGGPPPYLPVLDSSEMAEQEKQRRSPPETRERRASNPSSPKLSKTIPEIKEKLTETRERMKKETIEWKKKILYKLEKRLIIKLRRAQSSTGQRIEIDDLPEEGGDKGKKRGSPCHDRRGSSAGSVTDSVTGSVTESVTDDDEDDTPEHTFSLPQESDNEVRKCPQEDKKGKDPVMEVKINCEEVQNDIPCAEEEKTELCKMPARLIEEEKVEDCSKRFCNGFEKSLNADKEESNVETDGNIVKEDCVTEHCKEFKFYSEEETRSGSETSCSVSANVVPRDNAGTPISTELSESKRVKSPQQSIDLKTKCVTLASSANEKPKEGNKNLFEALSSGFNAPALKTDNLQLPEKTEQAPIITKQGMSSSLPETRKKDKPTETKKLDLKNEKLLTNLSSLKKRLQTCSKEVLKKKTDTVRCDRNIWLVLKRNGIS